MELRARCINIKTYILGARPQYLLTYFGSQLGQSRLFPSYLLKSLDQGACESTPQGTDSFLCLELLTHQLVAKSETSKSRMPCLTKPTRALRIPTRASDHLALTPAAWSVKQHLYRLHFVTRKQ